MGSLAIVVVCRAIKSFLFFARWANCRGKRNVYARTHTRSLSQARRWARARASLVSCVPYPWESPTDRLSFRSCQTQSTLSGWKCTSMRSCVVANNLGCVLPDAKGRGGEWKVWHRLHICTLRPESAGLLLSDEPLGFCPCSRSASQQLPAFDISFWPFRIGRSSSYRPEETCARQAPVGRSSWGPGRTRSQQALWQRLEQTAMPCQPRKVRHAQPVQ